MQALKLVAEPIPEPAADFDSFWLLYPRHEGKKDARKAFSRLTATEQMAAIVGIAKWRRLFLLRETNYILLPATWLRGERWDDELPTAQAAPTSSAHVPFAATAPGEPRAEMPQSVKDAIARLRRP